MIITINEVEQVVCDCRDNMIRRLADCVGVSGKSENDQVSVPVEALPSLW